MIGGDCPKCGCNDTTEFDVRVKRGRTFPPPGDPVDVISRSVKYRCNHCGRMFTVNEPWRPAENPLDAATGRTTLGGKRPGPADRVGDSVVYQPVCCPAWSGGCGSKNTKVTSKRKSGVRFHKCKDCGHAFKSVEK